MSSHQLWLASDAGDLLELVDNWISIEYTRSFNQSNYFELWTSGVPGGMTFARSGARQSRANSFSADSGQKLNLNNELLRPDRMLQIWRRPGGPEQRYGRAGQTAMSERPIIAPLRLETVGFLRSWDIRAADSLTITAALRGHDATGLIERRIIAYAKGTAESIKGDFADDMMKAMVRENMGADATDAARDLTSLGFTVQADTSQAASINKSFHWLPLMDALQEIADASRQEGIPLYFAIIPTSPTTFRFVTYINQPGQDRTVSSGNPLVFGLKWGNMSNAVYNESHIDEQNYIYSLGPGKGNDRKVDEVADEARIAVSAWNRIEGTADAREDDRTAAGNAALAERQPKVHFTADIHDTPDMPYGGPGGWDLGDKVTAAYMGLELDCVIETVHVRVERDGREEVRARIEHWG